METRPAHIILLFTAVTVMGGRLTAQQASGEEIIATVGDGVITAAEFRARFELTPRRLSSGSTDQQTAKAEMILSLIAEKLLAQAAVDQGLGDDPVYRKEMENVRQSLARDQLYRLEVQRKVTVSAEEVSKAMRDARRSVLVEYAHSTDSLDLVDVSFSSDTAWIGPEQKLGQGRILRDTVTVNWGEAEHALEAAVFSLAPGERSSIIPSSRGWFVCRVLSESRNSQAQQIGPLELRQQVEQTLRLRKEEQRLDEFMRVTLRTAVGKARRHSFEGLAAAIRSYAYEQPRILETGLRDGDREGLIVLLGSAWGDTLLDFEGEIRSVEWVVDRMIGLGFRPSTTAYPGLEQHLDRIFREWTWQGILAQVALKRGLDAHPEVDAQLQMWKTHYLAEAIRRHLAASVPVSVAEIHKLRRSTDPDCEVPVADVEILWSEDHVSVSRFLETSASQVVPIRRQDLGAFPDLEYEHIDGADVLWLVAVAGEGATRPSPIWIGPIETDTASVACRILALKGGPELPASVVDSLTQALRQMKARRVEAVLTARLSGTKGYTVFEDRVRDIPVSSVPMMAYRLLGFGGRMFAVPFVRTRTDWFGIDDEGAQVIP